MKNVKYFVVVAKCGHVGRNRYFRGEFYITAADGKEAARIARGKPRVKHDHDDAILSVEEITLEDFVVGEAVRDMCPYWTCSSRWEQEKIMPEIEKFIFPETEAHIRKKTKSKGKPWKAYKRPGCVQTRDYETYYEEMTERAV
ncbi:MAG: hypothetical protein LUD29_01845 [Clostridia bacterium]|nr:hypothetical protein [Clostridia bacterium]